MTRRDLIFRVFVSSTFGDLIAERNALQEKAFPELRKYCQERGARFQAIDLRWGVSQEAGLDQQTMTICFEELARCQDMSPKPNFIILLGDRYGWHPLPAQIRADEFEELLSHVPENLRALLVGDGPIAAWHDGRNVNRVGWYRKDLNAAPTEYVLQPRTIDFPQNASLEERKRITKGEAEDWRRIESEIRTVLIAAIASAGWTGNDPRRAKYERSATHQEIDHGALHPGLDAEKHVFAYFREITDAPADGSAAKFIDTGRDNEDLDALKVKLAGDLEQRIQGRLPDSHVYRYQAGWRGDHPESDLDALCERVVQDLKTIIDAELRDFQQRPELEREKEAHREFGQDRSKHFIGRQDILKRIEQYLSDPKDKHPLVVHGVSGSGKTALMARAVTNYQSRVTNNEVVFRFIGATPISADLRTLLRSLCQQLGIESPPTDMNELVKAFRERLAGPEKKEEEPKPANVPPTVVFLDALDQLNPTDNARMLYWMPRELATDVKMVISVLETNPGIPNPETRPPNPPHRDDPHDIARRIWPNSLVSVGELGAADGDALLRAWLDDAGRTLQDEQRNDILKKFQRENNRLPLYLKVAFEEARLWHSWDGLPCGSDPEPGLNDTVDGILVDMLHRLELPRNHGRLLVERALSGIAIAKNGLTEDELLDVLSKSDDQEIVKDYLNRNPQSPQDIDLLPVVVWSRLHADLKPYMTNRRADGTVVMNFYHRQVAEAVAARYLKDEPARLAMHERLANYFHTLDYWAESLEAQRARAKRLPPTPRPANVRKVVELPYHRLEAAKLGGKDDPKSTYWDVVADLLTDWQFLEAKAEADPNFQEQETKEPSAVTGEKKS